eukprot:PhM_4_TR8913/c0_g1_i1/m.43858/K20011/PRDX3; peroxiredoxin 3
MKFLVIALVAALLIASSTVSALKPRDVAPDFQGKVVTAGQITDVGLKNFRGKWLVLIFYPLDFTFVCPTELIAFSDKVDTFREVNTELLGVSVDSEFTHLAWQKVDRKDGGLGAGFKLPLVSDLTKKIATDYGVLLEEDGVAFRGTFIIDPRGIVRHTSVNDLPVGRNVDEVLRLIKAFQYADAHGEVCPANWRPGDDTMVPDPEKSKAYFEKVSKASEL